MLSEEVKATIETWRLGEYISPQQASVVLDAMLDLFPVRTLNGMVIRWDDEITPERLVACGYTPEFESNMTEQTLIDCTKPRNMVELWSFMERCGIEVPT